jgi:hypothetical protein
MLLDKYAGWSVLFRMEVVVVVAVGRSQGHGLVHRMEPLDVHGQLHLPRAVSPCIPFDNREVNIPVPRCLVRGHISNIVSYPLTLTTKMTDHQGPNLLAQ